MPARLTASAGIAAWASPLSADEVVAAADRVLYQAKRDGRDRACLSSGTRPDSSSSARGRYT
jgi:PleD family two-component response regulator